MAIKKLPDNCFFKVYDACDVGGVPMVYIPVYKKSVNLASVGSGFILPRETPIGPIYLSTIADGDIKQIRSVSGHYAILQLTIGPNTYYIAYIDGVNYGWIADPKAFEAKMKAYQLPRKSCSHRPGSTESRTMDIKKATIWGEEMETYHVTYGDQFIRITGPNGYELEGTDRGEVQMRFNLHHDPFNTL